MTGAAVEIACIVLAIFIAFYGLTNGCRGA